MLDITENSWIDSAPRLNPAVLPGDELAPSEALPPLPEVDIKGKKLFLPPHDPTNHKNLLKRWDYYLGNELTFANHELIRGFIWSVVNGPSGLRGANAQNSQGDTYTVIRFDCVEGTNQTVLQSDEYHLKNGDTDDTGLSAVTAYSKIVLITAPTAAPIPLDPQF